MTEIQRAALVMVIAFEVAFTENIVVNALLIVISLAALCYQKVAARVYGQLAVIALLPIIGSLTTFYIWGTGSSDHRLLIAGMMATRALVYITMGRALIETIDGTRFLCALEQELKLSSTLVYGILGAALFVPKVRQSLTTIRHVGLMRQAPLHLWSPMLYLKAIAHALTWSHNLAMAMTSHGFTEHQQRTHYHQYPKRPFGWVAAISLLIAVNIIMVATKGWLPTR